MNRNAIGLYSLQYDCSCDFHGNGRRVRNLVILPRSTVTKANKDMVPRLLIVLLMDMKKSTKSNGI